MKKFLLILISCLMMAAVVFAERAVTFVWDPNTELDLAGYRIYQSDTPNGQVLGPESLDFLADVPCGPNDASCCTYTKPASSGPGKYYVATAYDTDGNESLRSNGVETLPPGKVKNLTK